MVVTTMPYLQQCAQWPQSGRHILAHFDEHTVLVYQAYKSSIADYAVAQQHFGGEFSYNRMSWIKTNFLWMTYRCGWALKRDQERVLAVRLKRVFFNELLCSAVSSKHSQNQSISRADEVRLQWDPDHNPLGQALSRRAIQLGLRGQMLERYGSGREIVSIEDITPFVRTQHQFCENGFIGLHTPEEQVYYPGSKAAAAIGLDIVGGYEDTTTSSVNQESHE